MDPVHLGYHTHNMHSINPMGVVPHDLVPCLITTPNYLPLGGSSPPHIIRRYMLNKAGISPKPPQYILKKDVTKIRTTIYIFLYIYVI